MCSCKAMHDPYGLQHFYLARMEEGRRISKQKNPLPEAMAQMMANVLVGLTACLPSLCSMTQDSLHSMGSLQNCVACLCWAEEVDVWG